MTNKTRRGTRSDQSTGSSPNFAPAASRRKPVEHSPLSDAGTPMRQNVVKTLELAQNEVCEPILNDEQDEMGAVGGSDRQPSPINNQGKTHGKQDGETVSDTPILKEVREKENVNNNETLVSLQQIEGRLDQIVNENRVLRALLKEKNTALDTLTDRMQFMEQCEKEHAHHTKQIQMQLEMLTNGTRIRNIKIDGKAENDTEDLKKFICDLAKEEGKTCIEADIESIFRIGKIHPGNPRPRPIMVKFASIIKRNDVLYSKGGLKNNQEYNKIWVNDDVTDITRRTRDDMRAISNLCREKGLNPPKVHSDGIVVDGFKHRPHELSNLPKNMNIEAAKSIVRGDHMYFDSPHSKLSNMFRCSVVIQNQCFSSTEQAYQWAKATKHNENKTAELIKKEADVYFVKKAGGRVKANEAWDRMKLQLMEELVMAKFSQNSELREYLINTKDLLLHESTRDTFWGCGSAMYAPDARNNKTMGKDQMGKILMKVRKSLSATTSNQ